MVLRWAQAIKHNTKTVARTVGIVDHLTLMSLVSRMGQNINCVSREGAALSSDWR